MALGIHCGIQGGLGLVVERSFIPLMARAKPGKQTVWVVYIGLSRGGGAARYADENGQPTASIKNAKKFFGHGEAQDFMDGHGLTEETTYPESITINESDL